MRFHRKYQQFDPALLTATKDFFEAGPWKGSHEERVERFQTWWDRACETYGYQTCLIVHIREAADIFRIPPDAKPEDVLQLHSLTVLELFHLFRHEMHLRLGTFAGHSPEACDDAHSWACSLYYTARPTTFINAVKENKIPGVFEQDLIELDDAGGTTLHPNELSVFEALTDDLIEDLSDDPEVAALLDQFLDD